MTGRKLHMVLPRQQNNLRWKLLWPGGRDGFGQITFRIYYCWEALIALAVM